jgi:hypothetical protein
MTPLSRKTKSIIGFSIFVVFILLISAILIGYISSPSNDNTGDHQAEGVYTTIQEMNVKSTTGNTTFEVDSSWDAIGIDIECVSSADVSWMLYYIEQNSTYWNGSIPQSIGGSCHIDSGENTQAYYSLIPPGNYSNMFGKWSLQFNVQKGEAVILIVKVDNWRPLYLSYL